MEQSIKLSKLSLRDQYEKLMRAGLLCASPDTVGSAIYYQRVFKKELPSIKIKDLPTGKLSAFGTLPRVRTGAVVREIKLILGYSEENAQSNLGFGSQMLPDPFFAILFLYVLCPSHIISSQVEKFRLTDNEGFMDVQVTMSDKIRTIPTINYITVGGNVGKQIKVYDKFDVIMNKLLGTINTTLLSASNVHQVLQTTPGVYEKFKMIHHVEHSAIVFEKMFQSKGITDRSSTDEDFLRMRDEVINDQNQTIRINMGQRQRQEDGQQSKRKLITKIQQSPFQPQQQLHPEYQVRPQQNYHQQQQNQQPQQQQGQQYFQGANGQQAQNQQHQDQFENIMDEIEP